MAEDFDQAPETLPTPEGSPLDANHMIAVCRELFRGCAIDLDLDVSKRDSVSMERFVAWCVSHNLPLRDAVAITKKYKLPEGVCAAIDKVFRGNPWDCCTILSTIWPTIVLSQRPPLSSPLARITVAMSYEFHDKQMALIKGEAELAPGMSRTDGFLSAFVRNQFAQLMELVETYGIDTIHAEHSQFVDRPGRSLTEPPPPIPGE